MSEHRVVVAMGRLDLAQVVAFVVVAPVMLSLVGWQLRGEEHVGAAVGLRISAPVWPVVMVAMLVSGRRRARQRGWGHEKGQERA